MRGIKSTKTLDEKRQLCAGNKIKLKKQFFFEHEGSRGGINFKNIRPIKGYKSRREKVNMTKY